MLTIETITRQVVDLVRSYLQRVRRVSAPEGLLHAVVYSPEKLKEFDDTENFTHSLQHLLAFLD